MDLDGDGDPDFGVQAFLTQQFFFGNVGAMVRAAWEGLAPASLAEGQVSRLLALDFEHAGRSEDRDVSLARLRVEFSDGAAGNALSQQQVDALVAGLTLRGDDGDGIAEPTDPIILALGSAPVLVDGVATLVLPASEETRLPCCDVQRRLSLWLEIGDAATAAGLPGTLRVSIAGSAVDAEEAIDGFPVTVTAFDEDAWIEFAVTEASAEVVFSDGFEAQRGLR